MSSATINKRDLAIGTIMAIAMACIFVWAGGEPLLSTFVPGLMVAWMIFLWMQVKRIPLPEGRVFYPFFFSLLAWQFLHFGEEFMTGFRSQFPEFFGTEPYSAELFVGINMVSYFVFTTAFIMAFSFGLRFLLVPVLFFIVYGAIGNAISHTFWVLSEGAYFPGFFTAQMYWILGFMVLSKLVSSWRVAVVAGSGFGIVLASILAQTAKTV